LNWGPAWRVGVAGTSISSEPATDDVSSFSPPERFEEIQEAGEPPESDRDATVESAKYDGVGTFKALASLSPFAGFATSLFRRCKICLLDIVSDDIEKIAAPKVEDEHR